LPAGVYAKDVVLSVIGRIGVNGATNKVIEFHGPTVAAMTMDERMTLCNMAIEAGATCGICPPDQTTVDYLWPFIQANLPRPARHWKPMRNLGRTRTRCTIRSSIMTCPGLDLK
jgi:3-isopropylmalate/(R)-2-methylmalate dehydratase large subunit